MATAGSHGTKRAATRDQRCRQRTSGAVANDLFRSRYKRADEGGGPDAKVSRVQT
jgi:hypothetical protein